MYLKTSTLLASFLTPHTVACQACINWYEKTL
jgi:hypothetical protein